MYLSTIVPRTPEAKNLLEMIERYKAHNLAWEIVHRQRTAERDWLYDITPSKLTILSQHPIQKLNPSNWDVISEDFPPYIKKGECRNIRMHFNPVKNVRTEQRSGKFDLPTFYHFNGKEMSYREMIKQWFAEREKDFGFEILNLSSVKFQKNRFPKGENSYVTMGEFWIKGKIKINDPKKFTQAVQTGFAQGKSFGCGLMLLED